MKNNEVNIFIFISSIIVGILISMNISFTRGSSNVFLSSKQYQDAYNYKNKLYADISVLMDQYNKFSAKLEKYKNDDKNRNQVTNTISEELEENQIILGKVPLQGEGIEINMEDADTSDVKDGFEYQLRLIHNTDMIQILNDFKNSGAEAISVNGQRIIDGSEVYCSGPFLRINGVKMATPFVIYAIGNSEVLYNYMMSNENYLKILINRKIKISINQSSTVKIPAFAGEEKIKFMKSKE